MNLTKLLFSITLFFNLTLIATANATPVLVFKGTYGILGVDNVELNNELYNVRFDWNSATIFEDQQTADKASHALVDQVFSQDFFQSLNLCNQYNWYDCNPSSFTLGNVHTYGSGVSQRWGKIVDGYDCDSGSFYCRYLNTSLIVLPSNKEISIIDQKSIVGYLIGCQDCGSINSVWKKQSDVSEPASVALLGVGFIGFLVTRRRRLSNNNIESAQKPS